MEKTFQFSRIFIIFSYIFLPHKEPPKLPVWKRSPHFQTRCVLAAPAEGAWCSPEELFQKLWQLPSSRPWRRRSPRRLRRSGSTKLFLRGAPAPGWRPFRFSRTGPAPRPTSPPPIIFRGRSGLVRRRKPRPVHRKRRSNRCSPLLVCRKRRNCNEETQ